MDNWLNILQNEEITDKTLEEEILMLCISGSFVCKLENQDEIIVSVGEDIKIGAYKSYNIKAQENSQIMLIK